MVPTPHMPARMCTEAGGGAQGNRGRGCWHSCLAPEGEEARLAAAALVATCAAQLVLPCGASPVSATLLRQIAYYWRAAAEGLEQGGGRLDASALSGGMFVAGEALGDLSGWTVVPGEEVGLVLRALVRSDIEGSTSEVRELCCAGLRLVVAAVGSQGAVTIAQFACAVHQAAALAPGWLEGNTNLEQRRFFTAVRLALLACDPAEAARLLRGVVRAGLAPGAPEKHLICEVLLQQVYAAGPADQGDDLPNMAAWPPWAAADALLALNAWGVPRNGYPGSAVCEALLAMSLAGGESCRKAATGGTDAPVDTITMAALRFALALGAEDTVDAAMALGVDVWPQGQHALQLQWPQLTHSALADVDARVGGGEGFSGSTAVAVADLLAAVEGEEGIGVRQCMAALDACKGEVVAAKALLWQDIEARRSTLDHLGAAQCDGQAGKEPVRPEVQRKQW
jgi:hypothetical protein